MFYDNFLRINKNVKPFPNYLILILIICLGAFLRFWHLDTKPLWLDEIITALFSLGHSYKEIPLNTLVNLSEINQLFVIKPGVSCQTIIENLVNNSTHPPAFFCLLSQGMQLLPNSNSLHWQVRAIPALCGTITIVAIYFLNRIAFSQRAGLMAATLMAVSPFAVYLSQEARHYTLPMLIISLTLICLIDIVRNIRNFKQPKLLVLLPWIILNTMGFYVHYFTILTYGAQLLIIGWFTAKKHDKFRQNQPANRRFFILGNQPLSPILNFRKNRVDYRLIKYLLPLIFFLPWMPILFKHSATTETGWMPPPENIAPLYQTLVGWLIMVIAFPVEKQDILIKIISGLTMLGVIIWLAWYSVKMMKKMYQSPLTHLATSTLSLFIISCLGEFLIIIYLWQKDITVAPRYHFIYFPAFCALLGAVLTQEILPPKSPSNFPENIKSFIRKEPLKWVIIFVGIISCIFSNYNLVFLKSYHPDMVAKHLSENANLPLVVLIGYNDSQDIALGLSFALEIDRRKLPNNQQTYFAFMERDTPNPLHPLTEYIPVWQNLAKLPNLPQSKFNLWVVTPSLKPADYPEKLALNSVDSNPKTCEIDREQNYHVGVPYQLYTCLTKIM
jgi:uncharacterized membrane protein